MNGPSLTRLGEQQLDQARAASSGRAAVHGGHEHDLTALTDAVVLLTVATRA